MFSGLRMRVPGSGMHFSRFLPLWLAYATCIISWTCVYTCYQEAIGINVLAICPDKATDRRSKQASRPPARLLPHRQSVSHRYCAMSVWRESGFLLSSRFCRKPHAVAAETSPLDTDRKPGAIDNNDVKKDNTCRTLITDSINEPPADERANTLTVDTHGGGRDTLTDRFDGRTDGRTNKSEDEGNSARPRDDYWVSSSVARWLSSRSPHGPDPPNGFESVHQYDEQ